MLTRINNEIGITKPDEDCILVSFLSRELQDVVVKLQQEIIAKLSNVIWPMPNNALHITLCEIIQPKPYQQDKSELVAMIPAYEEIIEGLMPAKTIEIHFNSIECSQDAIIVKGTDDGTYNSIRSKLVKCLPLQAETKYPPEIIHCTIARFNEEIELDLVKCAVSALTIDHAETVSQFKLLTNTAPHLVNYSVRKTYCLK